MCGVIVASCWFFSSDEPIFQTANDIPSSYFKEKKEIQGVVVKVVDGDTFRIRHVNSYHTNPAYDGKLSENTISIRIAAIDTPEIAKFGNEGQAYSNEAKEFASNKILGKKITVKLLAKDRYSRALAEVRYVESRLLWNKNYDLAEELLKSGLAVVYRQGGAQYGKEGIEKWNYIEKKAQDKKKGVWKNGKDKADLPSDYKKKIKTAAKI